MINAAEKKFIEKYRKQIICAGKYNYYRCIPYSALYKLEEIYNRERKTNLRSNFSCSICTLDFLSKFYKYIYENKNDTI